MADLVSSVVTRVQSIVGDPAGQEYSSTTLIPFVQQALDDVALEFMSEGIERLRTTSATLSVAAGVTVLSSSSTPPLPTDFVSPIEMWERPAGGSVHDWQSMTLARENIPLVDQQPTLRFWQWEAGKIVLVGATSNVEVMLDYVSMPAAITGVADALPFSTAVSLVSYHVADLVYGARGEDSRRAECRSDYKEQLGNVINAAVRLKQRKPQRRKPARRRLAIY